MTMIEAVATHSKNKEMRKVKSAVLNFTVPEGKHRMYTDLKLRQTTHKKMKSYDANKSKLSFDTLNHRIQ